ncbi:MAG: hypothetical protein HKN88_06295 [Gammaproteobacteria bacterium]|nr:hypothetical protein [Gammaproteobacteria bacterium]NNC97666.1 hypothetical protein [Gammaproteobacteria bacterium]NNM12842.1 hypothetical protein [Gammaproteobacteria bacterium]
MKINQNKIINQQQGSTLFICLVMLLAISIVSLAGMKNSVLELVIANNKQQFNNTFQAAEAVIDARLNALSVTLDGSEVPDAEKTTLAQTTDVFSSADTSKKIATVNTRVFYRTEGPSLGWDINKGVAHHFQMEAVATAPAKNAVANYRIGFYVVAPSTK